MNQPAPMTQFQPSLREEALGLLSRLGVPDSAFAPEGLPARSPVTGEVMPLRLPSDVETVTESVLGPTLLRMSALMDATQRNQQTVLRGLRELMKQGQTAPGADKRLEELAASQEELKAQVNGIEVFLMRIDEHLHEVNNSLKRRAPAAVDKPLRIAVTALAAGTIGLTAIVALINF